MPSEVENCLRTTMNEPRREVIARGLVAFFLACLVGGAAEGAVAAAEYGQPNIVVILADDLGYGDVQCYNPQRGKIPTPNIDRLASKGMRFTDAHSSSGVCSPSRYALLTGRYHWRSRLQKGIVGYLEEPLIAPNRLTIAGLAKKAGYHTACIGKWHLGWDWNIAADERLLFAPKRGEVPQVSDLHRAAWQKVYSRPIAGGPTTRGFDEYFGTDVPNWPPYCFIANDRTEGVPTTLLPAELLEDHLASLPGPALANWKLEGVLPALTLRADQYIARRAKTRQPFFLYMALTSPHTPLAVNEAWRGKSGLESQVADLIMETDDAVGRVLNSLRENGVEDQTLVIFTSDNGFSAYFGARHLEGRGHFPSGPLRGYKGDAWEGGHRVAFVTRWPEIVSPGTTCSQLVHQADLMATFAEMFQTRLPDDAGEDSFSILPLLRGAATPVRENAVSQGASGLTALRLGSWKMIFGSGGGGPWSSLSEAKDDLHSAQLFNLDSDLAEATNLYARHPEIAANMTAVMERLVDQGRSTPGSASSNDVPVNWKRHIDPARKESGR